MDSIEKGIIELISKHAVKKLVMGAAAERRYNRYKQQNLFPHHHDLDHLIYSRIDRSSLISNGHKLPSSICYTNYYQFRH